MRAVPEFDMRRGPRYVPVLRTKQAEWTALRQLRADVRHAITPCLEVLPSEFVKGPQKLVTRIGRTWGSGPIFLDFGKIDPSNHHGNGDHPITELARAASGGAINPTIVVRTYDDEAFLMAAQRALSAYPTLSVAIRIHYADLEKQFSAGEINSILLALGSIHEDSDLIVDYDVIDATPPDYDWLCSRVPLLSKWRRFIVTGGSFPPDLNGLHVGIRAQPRYDWIHWQNWAESPHARVARTPDFGDYTIQHPVFEEPPEGANPSASIRWATESYWLIARGEALRSKKSSGHLQYYGNAQLLCECGEIEEPAFSYGDTYLWNAANRRGGPGNPTTWIAAGENHHITLTASQVAAL